MSGDSFADAAAAHEYQAVCQARGDAGQPQRAMRKPEYDRRYGQSRPKGVSRSASAAVPDALDWMSWGGRQLTSAAHPRECARYERLDIGSQRS